MDVKANEGDTDQEADHAPDKVVRITGGLEAQENMLLDEAIAASRADLENREIESESDSSHCSYGGESGNKDAAENDGNSSGQDDNSESARSQGTECSDEDEAVDEGKTLEM